MQVPVCLTIRNGLHALTRRFVTEILVSSLATLLVMAIFPNLTKPAFLFARDDGRLTSAEARPVGSETSEALDDFMERVALSHVAGLRAPPVAAIVASSEPTAGTGVPLPPRPVAAPRHDRPSSSKVHVAASVPKVPPPVQPPLVTVEPAAVSAPVAAEPPPPLQYGMRLVAGLGNIISVSQTRVVQSMASVGDTLTSLVKKL